MIPNLSNIAKPSVSDDENEQKFKLETKNYDLENKKVKLHFY